MLRKVSVLCVMAMLILSSMFVTQGAGRKKILYDRTHDEHYSWPSRNYLSDVEIKDLLEANGFDVTIYNDGKLDSSSLQNYDGLIICVPRKNFTGTEIEDIVNFVKNGGGLYVLGSRSSRFYGVGGIEAILNALSAEFKVTYVNVNNVTIARPFDVKSTHDIFIGIKEVRFEDWTVLRAESPAEVLLTVDDGGMIAATNMEFGKAVFAADDAMLTLDILDNIKLSVNILNWVTTYGGPYKNYQKRLTSANSLFASAMSLYNQGNYAKAKEAFSLAKGRYETLTSFYKTGEHIGKIAQCETYIKRIEDELNKKKGTQEALNLLAQGKQSFEAKDYQTAQQILQQARDAFQRLNMTNEYAQAQDMLSKIEEELRLEEEEKQRQEEERQRQEKEKAEQEAAKKRMYTFIGIGIAFVIIILLAVFIFARGRKPKRRSLLEERETIVRKYRK